MCSTEKLLGIRLIGLTAEEHELLLSFLIWQLAVIVKDIKRLSATSREAIVTLGNMHHCVDVLCYSCALEIGAEITADLRVVGARDFQLAQTHLGFKRINDMSYDITANVDDRDAGILRLFGFVFRVGPGVIPEHISNNTPASFRCDRLELER